MIEQSVGKTGIVTGKTQRSAQDFQEKVETSFLEKYVTYILRDIIGQKYFMDLDPNPALFKCLYKIKEGFNLEDLINKFYIVLKKASLQQHEDQNYLFMQKQFENKFAQNSKNIEKGEYIYLYTRLKASNSKLKEIFDDILKKLEKEIDLINNQTKIINIIIFYTGDINFEFSNDKRLIEDFAEIKDNMRQFRLQVYYISKRALFEHFIKTNKLNVDQITDQQITLYELQRMSYKRREQIKQRADSNGEKQKPNLLKKVVSENQQEIKQLYQQQQNQVPQQTIISQVKSASNNLDKEEQVKPLQVQKQPLLVSQQQQLHVQQTNLALNLVNQGKLNNNQQQIQQQNKQLQSNAVTNSSNNNTTAATAALTQRIEVSIINKKDEINKNSSADYGNNQNELNKQEEHNHVNKSFLTDRQENLTTKIIKQKMSQAMKDPIVHFGIIAMASLTVGMLVKKFIK